MDQYLLRRASLPVGESTDSPLLTATLTPHRIIDELVSGSVVGSQTGEPMVAVAQPRTPDLSREGPFDVHKDYSASGASPWVLDRLRGCQHRMTSYDEENGSPDFNPAFGIHLHDQRAAAGICGCAIVRSTGCITWDTRRCFRLRCSFNTILSNVQVLQQFVTSLNRMSSEVMHIAFDREPFPSDEVQNVAPGTP